jgi:hypothetical protein
VAIPDKAITAGKLAAATVSSSKLAAITLVPVTGKVEAGKQAVVSAACKAGEVLLDSSYSWEAPNMKLSVQEVTRTGSTASVRGTNGDAAEHELTVRAVCLAP